LWRIKTRRCGERRGCAGPLGRAIATGRAVHDNAHQRPPRWTKKTPTPKMDIATPRFGCWELCCQQLVKPAWLLGVNVAYGKLESKKTIDLVKFFNVDDIDPRYFERRYCVGPGDKLLVKASSSSGRPPQDRQGRAGSADHRWPRVADHRQPFGQRHGAKVAAANADSSAMVS
jgi:hypothetical protein